jgi:hypothetical protein
MPKLPLHFKDRKALLRTGHKVYSNKPVPVWQITALQNSSTSQGSPGFAMFALILKNGLLLVVLLTSTLSAGYSNIISYLLEFQHTRFFDRKTFNKFD